MNAREIYDLLHDCGIEDEKMDVWTREDLLSLFMEIYWGLEDRFQREDD